MSSVQTPLGSLMRLLRMLPALVLVAMQISMAGMPVSAAMSPPEHPEITALAEMLGEAQIILCTPEGSETHGRQDDHAGMDKCPWCQGFGVTLLPIAPCAIVRTDHTPAVWAAPSRTTLRLGAPSSCNPCRAPPALI